MIQPGKTYNSIKAASFIFDQATSKTDKVIDHLCTIDEIETKTGLDFLRELPDDFEEKIESNKHQAWAQENFK
ncbi:hypothetical protein KKG19_06145 [Patescibacteria group bacterium]|nr:hypothetical protein [Patescibacteria group bacterium]